MIRSSACQPWQPDRPGHAGDGGGPPQLHHATGHDPFFARGVPGAQPRSPGVVTPSKAARPPAAGRGYSRLCEPGQLLSTRGAESIPRPCAQATMTTLFNWTDVGAPAPSLAIPYLNWTWGPLGAWGLCFSAHP